MLKRLVPAALVVVAMMVPLPRGLANAGSIDVTPSGPYLPGLNGIVVEGSSSAAAVAHTIEAESGLEVDAIWLLSTTWRFYLPDQPEIDGGLNEFSGPVAAAFVVLAAATPVTSEPTGIAEVDAVVEAVRAGNVDALVSMVRYTDVVCTSEPPAAGLPPLCASVGLPEGSELATLPIIALEGEYMPRDRVPQFFEQRLRDSGFEFYGVLQPQQHPFSFPESPVDLPVPDYAVVFRALNPPGHDLALHLLDGKIIAVEVVVDRELPSEDDPRWIVSPERGGRPVVYPCPVDPAVCDFAEQLRGWVEDGDYASIFEVAEPEKHVCPGPRPLGLGGPFPLCDGGEPGEVRAGYDYGALQSEIFVYDAAAYEARLRAWFEGGRSEPQLATVGCEVVNASSDEVDCSAYFGVVFVRAGDEVVNPNLEDNRELLLFVVSRDGDGPAIRRTIQGYTLANVAIVSGGVDPFPLDSELPQMPTRYFPLN